MGTVRYDHCLKQGDGQISLEWGLSAEVTWKISLGLDWALQPLPSSSP